MESLENSNIDKLSPREKEVATYIANGVSTNDIAKIENIGTVQSNFMMTEVKYKTNFMLK